MPSRPATLSPDPACPLGEAVNRWTRRKHARPGEILDAALDCFVARGFAASKMEDIARAAGVTAGTLYRYFANKEEILKAVIRETFAPTLQEGELLIEHYQGSASELLSTVLALWWRQHGATRLSGIPKLMIAEGNNFPELARFHHEVVIAPGERLIGRALQYGMDRGEFRRMPVEMAVRVVIAPIVMAMLWQHAPACVSGDFDIARYLEEAGLTLKYGICTKQEQDKGDTP